MTQPPDLAQLKAPGAALDSTFAAAFVAALDSTFAAAFVAALDSTFAAALHPALAARLCRL